MMRKKIIVVIFLLSLWLIPIAFVDAASFKIESSVTDFKQSEKLKPGGEAEYQISAVGSNYTTTEMDLEYDDNLEIISITPFEGFKEKEIGDIKKNPVHIKLSGIESDKSLILFTIKFRVKENAKTAPAVFKLNNVKDKSGNKVDDFTQEVYYYLASSKNKITSFGVEGGTLLTDFASDKYEYDISVPANRKELTITASTEDQFEKIEGLGKVSIEGKNEIELVGVAENGSRQTYLFHIRREKEVEVSSNNYLKTLVPSAGYLEFNPETLQYSFNVANSIEKISIVATPQDANALVDYSGLGDLAEGENTVKIIVTAPNGETRTYTLLVNRLKSGQELDDDTSLSSLEIKNYKIEFAKDVYEYTIEVDNLDPLEIDAVAASTNSKVTIQGNENLKYGSEICVVVTAETGKNQKYLIKVIEKKKNSMSINDVVKNPIAWIVFVIAVAIVAVVIIYYLKKKNDKK